MQQDPQLYEYILSHIDAEPDNLRRLGRDVNLRLLYPRMCSGHLQGRLLRMLTAMIAPQRALEIGTYAGYSALCIAEGLPEGGRLDTVEIDGEEKAVSVPNEYNENAFYFQLVRLLKEMLANEVITTSVVCSLFNERAEALDGNAPDAYSLKKGFYQDTPEYLVNEEIRMLKDVGR